MTRRTRRYLYVIAVRRGGGDTSSVTFSGLRERHDGSPITRGAVAVRVHPGAAAAPDPSPSKQEASSVKVSDGSFGDWFGPHDARVYRFDLDPT